MKTTNIDFATYLNMNGVPMKSICTMERDETCTVIEAEFDISEEDGRKKSLDYANSQIYDFVVSRGSLLRLARQRKGRDFNREIQREIRDSLKNKPIGSKP
jgi:hypothetical protein